MLLIFRWLWNSVPRRTLCFQDRCATCKVSTRYCPFGPELGKLMLRATAFSGDRLGYNRHARLTTHGREKLARKVVEGRLTPAFCAMGCAWIFAFVFCNIVLKIPVQARGSGG